MMNTVKTLLQANSKVSGYKINRKTKESFELFFVKGRLETVRGTDVCDTVVTVYADHDGFRGDAQFIIYPSTTEADLVHLIDEAAGKALLINNAFYELPDADTGDFRVESNFSDKSLPRLAEEIAEAVFSADTVERAALNSLEIFVNKYTTTVENSLGLSKTQISYDAMVEAIPTYNGDTQSVELYQQVNFSSFDAAALAKAIGEKLLEAKARYEAAAPAETFQCPVVLRSQEVSELLSSVAWDLNYAGVYNHSNLFKKGDTIQAEPTGDLLHITMAGSVPGCVRSACFDSDGVSLGELPIVENGVAVNYFGSNRFGQYLGEVPTGELRCLKAAPGSVEAYPEEHLEVLSMSGLQVDLFSDYIGGEVRLALHHKGGSTLPLTGLSVAGSLRQVLSSLRLSSVCTAEDGYYGPEKALLDNIKIF